MSERIKSAFQEAAERLVAARKPITMSDGKFPISDQHSAQSAWDLRNNSTTHGAADVVTHIRKAVAELGLTMPKDANARQQAADSVYMLRPHGFSYPTGMPDCSVCGQGPNTGAHVNPSKSPGMSAAANNWGVMVRQDAEDRNGPMPSPRRTHVYTSGQVGWISNLRCAACRQPMSASAHTPGMPVGPLPGTLGAGVDVTQPGHQRAAVDDPNGIGTDPSAGNIVMVKHKFEALDGQSSIGDDYKMCRHCGFPQDDVVHELDADGKAQEPQVIVKQMASYRVTDRPNEEVMRTAVGTRQQAFVTQLGGKVILSAPAEVFSDPAGLPREIAAEWEKQSASNPHFMWLKGAYVEANRPNRNMAMWSSDDLEFGTPSVAHGPINMLHQERHIVGTLAAASLVVPERQSADDGGVNTIHALGAIWRYLFPVESRQIAQASAENKLWYSMESISREVACQAPGCSHVQSYRDYMLAKETRCQHVKDGAPRRFVDPVFDGAGIIIPPVRPGWPGANATIMRQAAMLAEGQQDSLSGLTEEEAVSMVSQIIRYATKDAA